MNTKSNAFREEGKYKPGLVARPRLWLITSGLLLIMAGGSFYFLNARSPYLFFGNFESIRLVSLTALIGGAVVMTRALVSDLMVLHHLRISKSGIQIMWSYVPQLYGARVNIEDSFLWNDIDSVAWLEGENELDLTQHLRIRFKEKVGFRKKEIKILVSDDRDANRCHELLSLLPDNFVVPEWVAVIRKESHQNPPHHVNDVFTVNF